MKVEFNSRVDLQREVIKIVNRWNPKIQLTGLSKAAIENWCSVNNLADQNLKNSLIKISEKLFFIANKSQDQISEEYKNLQFNVRRDIDDLKEFLLIVS